MIRSVGVPTVSGTQSVQDGPTLYCGKTTKRAMPLAE